MLAPAQASAAFRSATTIRADSDFTDRYARLDPGRYQAVVSGMARLLFDHDTMPGAEPEDLLRLDVPALVIPGQDDSHATSAARYLGECLARAEYWDIPVSDQTDRCLPSSPKTPGRLESVTAWPAELRYFPEFAAMVAPG